MLYYRVTFNHNNTVKFYALETVEALALAHGVSLEELLVGKVDNISIYEDTVLLIAKGVGNNDILYYLEDSEVYFHNKLQLNLDYKEVHEYLKSLVKLGVLEITDENIKEALEEGGQSWSVYDDWGYSRGTFTSLDEALAYTKPMLVDIIIGGMEDIFGQDWEPKDIAESLNDMSTEVIHILEGKGVRDIMKRYGISIQRG